MPSGPIVTGATSFILVRATDIRDWHINSIYQNNTRRNATYAWVFNSNHPDGAQFVFGDGSVDFLKEDMDYKIFAAMAYIHDGLAFDREDF